MIEKIKRQYKFIKEWFWALPMWKRAIITSIIGAVGGSSIIGFFNKYALYYHAICQNFRVPVEGVEYLDLAITLVSFAFILTSIFGSIIVYAIINLIADFFASRIFNDLKKANKLKKILIYFQAVIPALYIVSFLTKASFFDFDNEINLDKSTAIISIGIILIITTIGLIFSKKNKSKRQVFTLSVVLGGTILIITSLFNQNLYKLFLEKIKYGGEIPINIEYRKADNTETNVDGLLLIRTSKSITIKNLDSKNISEIPIERVSKIIFVSK